MGKTVCFGLGSVMVGRLWRWGGSGRGCGGGCGTEDVETVREGVSADLGR